MNITNFLERDLSKIKKELTTDIIKKEYRGFNILAFYDFCKDLLILKYLLKFCKINFPEIFLKSYYTILSVFCSHAYKRPVETPKAKYILKFSIQNFPYSFLKKYYEQDIVDIFEFDHNGYVIYRKINIYLYTGGNREKVINRYVLEFLDYNFPEISLRTNNFILPLMMEI